MIDYIVIGLKKNYQITSNNDSFIVKLPNELKKAESPISNFVFLFF